MGKSKIEAKARWRDEIFQNEIQSVISSLITGATSLSELDLGGISIGSNGPIEKLWEVNLVRAKFTDIDLSYADIACSMNEANFTRVCFAYADFDRCLLRNSRVIECDFTGAKLIVSVDDSVFENCKFAGAAFLGGKGGTEYGGRRAKFIKCDFTSAKFKRVEFRATQFTDCIFDDAKFSQCDLRGVKVEGTGQVFIDQFEKMDMPPFALIGRNTG